MPPLQHKVEILWWLQKNKPLICKIHWSCKSWNLCFIHQTAQA